MDTRIEREREFHNSRFADSDARGSQLKYYWAISNGSDRFAAAVREKADGANVLDYGCANGENALTLCRDVVSYTGIDISDVAIATARNSVADDRFSFRVADAMHTGLESSSFDLIFGSGIIHHLDTDACAKELHRLLRPGGTAIFWEPLGKNPLINLYRSLTPSARTADEHPLLKQDMVLLGKTFSQVDLDFFGLTSLFAVPVRQYRPGHAIRSCLWAADRALLQIPLLRYWAWFTLITMRKD